MPHPLDIACLGGAVINRKLRGHSTLITKTSNPVSVVTTFGGVARNIAETMARLGTSTLLVSVWGEDADGEALNAHLRGLGIDTSLCVTRPDAPTATYLAMLEPSGELAIAAAAMDVFNALTPDRLDAVWEPIARARAIFADCNLPADTLAALIARCKASQQTLAINTVSVPKAGRLPTDLSGIALLFANEDEARALVGDAGADASHCAAALLDRGAGAVIITLGADGCLLATADGETHFPAPPASPVDVTGAGDALIAGTLHGVLAGRSLAEACVMGQRLAAKTVESTHDVLENAADLLAADLPADDLHPEPQT
ncbi:MAG: carbohydrate kinase family protein [Devosiaceae bacterium]|nr:carbohydrate kinase family protein [Devosiaceae bacterium MH13]